MLRALAMLAGTAGLFAVTITATPVRAEKPEKVAVCHVSRDNDAVRHTTLHVSAHALKGHLKHGDTAGACGA